MDAIPPSLLPCVRSLLDRLVVTLPRARQRMQLVENELIPVGVVESAEAGDPLQRVLRAQVFEGSRVKLVPRRVPARPVVMNALREIPRAEVVADRGQMRHQRNIVAADG